MKFLINLREKWVQHRLRSSGIFDRKISSEGAVNSIQRKQKANHKNSQSLLVSQKTNK